MRLAPLPSPASTQSRSSSAVSAASSLKRSRAAPVFSAATPLTATAKRSPSGRGTTQLSSTTISSAMPPSRPMP